MNPSFEDTVMQPKALPVLTLPLNGSNTYSVQHGHEYRLQRTVVVDARTSKRRVVQGCTLQRAMIHSDGHGYYKQTWENVPVHEVEIPYEAPLNPWQRFLQLFKSSKEVTQ